MLWRWLAGWLRLHSTCAASSPFKLPFHAYLQTPSTHFIHSPMMALFSNTSLPSLQAPFHVLGTSQLPPHTRLTAPLHTLHGGLFPIPFPPFQHLLLHRQLPTVCYLWITTTPPCLSPPCHVQGFGRRITCFKSSQMSFLNPTILPSDHLLLHLTYKTASSSETLKNLSLLTPHATPF